MYIVVTDPHQYVPVVQTDQIIKDQVSIEQGFINVENKSYAYFPGPFVETVKI